jgi:hypothetical protein
MSEDLRRGLDPRDCRLDVGMILGDSSVPDNVNWPLKDRDKTCVWLDFVDTHFNPIYNSSPSATESNVINTNLQSEETSASGKDNEVEYAINYQENTLADGSITKITDSRVYTNTDTSAVSENKTITTNVPGHTARVTAVENKTIRIGEN